MASGYELLEATMRERLERPLPPYLRRSGLLYSRLRVFAAYVTVPTIQYAEEAGIEAKDRGITLALDDGFKVAVYGLGQVIRQSGNVHGLGPERLKARLLSGTRILRSIADLQRDRGVSIEVSYGFRPENDAQFSNPAWPLVLEGDEVGLSRTQLAPPSDKPGGCPFKKNMERLYGPLTDAMVGFYD